MRHTARALVGIVLVACCSGNVSAADTGSSWWPFGHHDDKTAAPPTAAPSTSPLLAPRPSAPPAVGAPLAQMPNSPGDAAAKEHWMLKSQDSKVGWPHLAKPHMPTTGIFAQKPSADATRNSWADKTPAPPKPSPLKPVTDGAHKVAQGTKKAWHKTVDALTPGEPAPARPNSSARIAKREVEPPFWKRMFGAKSEMQQPQTVPEWMAQRRVDP